MKDQNIALSINLNKIALIRNAREGNNPDVAAYGEKCLDYGAAGLTVHPRPDQRHIRPEDCRQLKTLVEHHKTHNPSLEFNIEGNPFAGRNAANRKDFSDYPGFVSIVEQCLPDQVTLVPDTDSQLTSDHGFDLSSDNEALRAIVDKLQKLGCRVSLFMDPSLEQISLARDIGADRIELYTGPFANAYSNDTGAAEQLFDQHCAAAEHAHNLGLGINAGHDLNLDNLKLYRSLPHLAEVSIGHALTIDALEYGLRPAIDKYLSVLSSH